MEILLGNLTKHAVNYAIRSGIAVTTSFTIQQCAKLLKTVDDNSEYQELNRLHGRLSNKIQIISPSIDMIELISARGNTSLDSAITLTKQLRHDIEALSTRMAKAVGAEQTSRDRNTRDKTLAEHKAELKNIMSDIRHLLERIDESVPLISLAITTSGARLSNTLPDAVSPSRLLQASTFLSAGDTQFMMNPTVPMPVGPPMFLSLYMLFTGNLRESTDHEEFRREQDNSNGQGHLRNTTWKEVIHKARVQLLRMPSSAAHGNSAASPSNFSRTQHPAAEFHYQIQIIEDLDDGRVHTYEDGDPQPGYFDGVELAGIRESIPIQQISKIFYADTGKILELGSESEPNRPVLLLKRDINSTEQRDLNTAPGQPLDSEETDDRWQDNDGAHSDNSSDSQEDIDAQLRRESSVLPESSVLNTPGNTKAGTVFPNENAWCLPQDLDPEWLAFEVYTELENDDSDDEPDIIDSSTPADDPSYRESSISNLEADISDMSIGSHTPQIRTPLIRTPQTRTDEGPPPRKPIQYIKPSLSLLEVLVRLMSLQHFSQSSHLGVTDEILAFFLNDSPNFGNSVEERHEQRYFARQKIGFDPYRDTPAKPYQHLMSEDSPMSNRSPVSESWGRERTPLSPTVHSHPSRLKPRIKGVKGRRDSGLASSSPQPATPRSSVE